MKYNAIDLFCGCGGMTEGIKQAGFNVSCGIEIDEKASECYLENHKKTTLIREDIREVAKEDIKKTYKGQLHLLAGCPPCQGFSSVRRLNRKEAVEDERNSLITEFVRLCKELKPYTIMLENVPALKDYKLFKESVAELEETGYKVDYDVVDLYKFGVPQHRRRLVLVGSRIGEINIAPVLQSKKTVKDFIKDIEDESITTDKLHKIYPKHTKRIQEMISLIPKDGGSRKDLPEEYILECHKKENVGFNDIYGRLKWDKSSSTITGGCLNPSKGRFLHPEKDRCITAREAALLQTFPKDYYFPVEVGNVALARMIGNALPPEFCKVQSENIYNHLSKHIDTI